VTDPEDIGALRTYENDKKRVSNYFRKRGKYQRLVLNNPVQARSAFQTKRAAILLFDYIVENGHQWKARIANIPHDEFVLEVADELVEEYKPVLEKCMIDAGNYYLTSGMVKMGAEANAGVSWYQAKLSPKELEKYLEKLAQSQTNH
jgi:DNA polymerase I-like protein with 3'-5' exonuclease and polymerase domains